MPLDAAPAVPRSFEPPGETTNATGELRWWTGWQDAGPEEWGYTALYAPDEDRLVVNNRIGAGEGFYTHDDQVRDLIERSPFPRFPETNIPGEAGGRAPGGNLTFSAELPTVAGGAWVSTERLDGDKELLEKGDRRVGLDDVYTHIYGLALLDFPDETVVTVSWGGRGPGVTEDTFQLESAYRELQFAGHLPEPKVTFPVEEADL